MPFEESGLHLALQGRKVYMAVGLFGSDSRGKGNIGGSFIGSHFRERKEEWKFQRRKISRRWRQWWIMRECESM
jgi:hypothetical protein